MLHNPLFNSWDMNICNAGFLEQGRFWLIQFLMHQQTYVNDNEK